MCPGPISKFRVSRLQSPAAHLQSANRLTAKKPSKIRRMLRRAGPQSEIRNRFRVPGSESLVPMCLVPISKFRVSRLASTVSRRTNSIRNPKSEIRYSRVLGALVPSSNNKNSPVPRPFTPQTSSECSPVPGGFRYVPGDPNLHSLKRHKNATYLSVYNPS